MPAKNLKELIDLIKTNPDKYSYAQPATGSTPHLVAELMKQIFALDMVAVPFNGAPLAINSTLGNHTQIAFTALPPAIGPSRTAACAVSRSWPKSASRRCRNCRPTARKGCRVSKATL